MVMKCSCFSPVAGIQWVETSVFPREGFYFGIVSVPLPGFSGLKPWPLLLLLLLVVVRFSPVAGIQWVETLDY